MIKSTDTILFQGDSITDASRLRDDPNPNASGALGRGYAFLAAAELLAEHPEGLKVYNRGVSGDRITYMAKRWEQDCFALKPTVVSILIGVNDTWHGVAKNTPENGVDLEEYNHVYRQLIADTRTQLPGVKIIVCEPFVTECGAVTEMNFHPDIDERTKIAGQIANDLADVFVPFQTLFDDAVKRAEPAAWADDGVHPTTAGHMLMAKAWLKATA